MPVIEQVTEGDELVTYERADALDPFAPRVETARVPLPPETVNANAIQHAAGLALAANSAYLAIVNPSNAQVAAQVKALTRQMNKLIRLATGRFDNVD